MTDYRCSENYPVYNLKPAKTVKKLTEYQQKYAYYLSLAAVAGTPILFEQVWNRNLEIFEFLGAYVKLFAEDTSLYTKVLDENSQTQRYLHQYIGYFFYQGGCFLGFGDTKFIPRCSQPELYEYVSALYTKFPCFMGLDKLFDKAKDAMYSLDLTHVGFGPSGQTWYFSPEIGKPEAEAFNEYMTQHNILKENSCVRFEHDIYYIVRASVYKLPDQDLPNLFNGKKVVIRYGAFSKQLELCCKHLEIAIQYAENDTQRQMLRELIAFYKTGDMSKHLDYSRFWVQDANPTVETYYGFIETYRDPTGVRAEYEAFVACVDPDSSRYLEYLLQPHNCSKILAALPMPALLYRDTFNPPTYKAIDIIVFPTSGLPIGINIPNYDCIRQSFGFKNVSLQNVMAARETKLSEIQYIPEAIKPLLVEFDAAVLKAEVATHELFGHGSGGLLYKEYFEKLSTQQKLENDITGFYLPNETFYGKFGDIYSAFEECRAEVSAFYLTFEPLIAKVFCFPEDRLHDVQLAATYSVFLAGLGSLSQFKDGMWLYAHSQARFSIIRYVMERTDAAKVVVTENGGNLEIYIDAARLDEIVAAYSQMIRELNVIKASGDAQRGKQLFSRLSAVEGSWLQIKEIVYQRRKPRAVYIQAVLGLHSIEDWEGENMNGLEVGIVSVANMVAAGVM